MTANKFHQFLSEDGHDNVPGYNYQKSQMFRGIDLKGKRLLDIGSGRGLTAIWALEQGCEFVSSMEPEEAGSRNGMIDLQRDRFNACGHSNYKFLTCTFQEFDNQGDTFDVIVSNASINHIHESQKNAMKDAETYGIFVDIAKRIHALLNPGGVAVVTDACRNSAFGIAKSLGLPNRFCLGRKTIDPLIHQDGSVWKRIFRDAGFSRIELSYPIPYRLRLLEPALNNAFVNFFLMSRFILRAWA